MSLGQIPKQVFVYIQDSMELDGLCWSISMSDTFQSSPHVSDCELPLLIDQQGFPSKTALPTQVYMSSNVFEARRMVTETVFSFFFFSN